MVNINFFSWKKFPLPVYSWFQLTYVWSTFLPLVLRSSEVPLQCKPYEYWINFLLISVWYYLVGEKLHHAQYLCHCTEYRWLYKCSLMSVPLVWIMTPTKHVFWSHADTWRHVWPTPPLNWLSHTTGQQALSCRGRVRTGPGQSNHFHPRGGGSLWECTIVHIFSSLFI